MPWKETQVFEQRIEFVEAYVNPKDFRTMTELCQCYGISRKTGYKTIRRLLEGGWDSLHDLSRAPANHPNATPKRVVDAILEAKVKRPTWGPRKLLWTLREREPDTRWPARSTVGEILKRNGMVKPRRASRPRTPHGPPFASVAIGGLSRLSVWFIRLGIQPERIAPGQPQQNGRHERFHRTLSADVVSPPKSTFTGQQMAFTRYWREYNFERPHESLHDKTPASVYEASPRPFPRRLPEVTYPSDYQVRSVRHDGTFRWRGEFFYLSEALIGERVGLEQATDSGWRIWFCGYELGSLDERQRKVSRDKLPPPQRPVYLSTEGPEV